jgi:F-type H+-transporting ATPase subunit epsilon
MATLPTEIELQIVTPERHVLQETVQSVEIPGKEGYLGVLPGHAPLLTELGVGTLTYKTDSTTRFLTVMNGYAEVLPDRVIVLAEISERAEEINVERTRAAEANARAQLAKASAGEREWKDASLALERALVRLQTAAKVGSAAASVGSSQEASH